MIRGELRQRARYLREQAEEIRRHAFTNFFQHTFTCARYGQASKPRAEERCNHCPLRPFVPSEYGDEAFPCQHITAEGWGLVARQPELPEKVLAALLASAAQLEAAAACTPTS